MDNFGLSRKNENFSLEQRIANYFCSFLFHSQQLKNKISQNIISKMSIQHNQQSLYEIPNCTICLNQLNDQLSNLNCGHVFHLSCITQHFKYRGTCPNCQKRSFEKEIRMVVYPLTKNTQSAMLMRQVLGNLSHEEKQQVQILFKQVQATSQKNEKLQSRLGEAQKQLKKSTKQLDQTKRQFNKTKIQLQTLRKDSIDLKKVIEHLHNQIKNFNKQNFDLRVIIQDYKQKQSQYQKLKKLKRIMTENAHSLIAYKNELQNKSTSPQEMSKIFFDMIMIKNLDNIKLKSQMDGFPEKIKEKEAELAKIKQFLEREKKEIKELQQKRALQKKKYDDLKLKYQNLISKYKALCQEMSDEQNYSDSMLSRPSFPLINRQVSTNKLNDTIADSRIKQENIPSNILNFVEIKTQKRNSSNFLTGSNKMEEQQIKLTSKDTNNQKKPVQQSLNEFVTQKNTLFFGSFGGVAANKKKADDKKVTMKNLFG